jgi:hypothetical protein
MPELGDCQPHAAIRLRPARRKRCQVPFLRSGNSSRPRRIGCSLSGKGYLAPFPGLCAVSFCAIPDSRPHWRWSSYNDFALDRLAAAAWPIYVGHVTLPERHRA